MIEVFLIYLSRMINLSYTVTRELQESIDMFARIRERILLTPISPQNALDLRWSASIRRIYYALTLRGIHISRQKIAEAITGTQSVSDSELKLIVGYKRAYDYATAQWIATDKHIRMADVVSLYESLTGREYKATSHYFKSSRSNVEYFLDYLQRYPEKPVVQAAIAYIQIADLKPFPEYRDEIANLLSIMFLYKWGFDIRGFLSVEEYWYKHRYGMREIIENVSNKGGLTSWLEYYAKGLVFEAEEVLKRVSGASFKQQDSALLSSLNKRQKLILSLLEEPFSTISNREVQKRFQISQITASRDLNRLAGLGLIFSHGKGRAVYYTRV